MSYSKFSGVSQLACSVIKVLSLDVSFWYLWLTTEPGDSSSPNLGVSSNSADRFTFDKSGWSEVLFKCYTGPSSS